jgi:hypothetical protein
MSESPKQRKRRPTLRAALEAAKAAGKTVRSATVEDGKVTLCFVGDDTPKEAGSDEWDEALRGKH